MREHALPVCAFVNARTAVLANQQGQAPYSLELNRPIRRLTAGQGKPAVDVANRVGVLFEVIEPELIHAPSLPCYIPKSHRCNFADFTQASRLPMAIALT